MKKLSPGWDRHAGHAPGRVREPGQRPRDAHLPKLDLHFSDVATGQAIFAGEKDGYYYTRIGNPNACHLALKSPLEGLDLQAQSDRSGCSLSRLRCSPRAWRRSRRVAGLPAHRRYGHRADLLYSGTFVFLKERPAPGYPQSGCTTTLSKAGMAFCAIPAARLAYAETPQPDDGHCDLAVVAEVAHRYARLMVDNTFATPYCQRPLSLGADVVIHSTTKYLCGHGTIIGGALVSSHPEFVKKEIHATLTTLGGSPSPFDCWLTNLGLKTFELRMARHCENALAVARYLEGHPKVAHVNYPGLKSHPGHKIANQQMSNFGGMLSFELKDGMQAGTSLMEHVQVATLAAARQCGYAHPAPGQHDSSQPACRGTAQDRHHGWVGALGWHRCGGYYCRPRTGVE